MTGTRSHPRRLLAAAEALIETAPRSAAFRRRAVSSTYYAAFHALAELCVEVLLADRDAASPEVRRIYRSLDHGPIKNVFGQEPLRSHPELRRLGNLVVSLQTARLDADYQPPDPSLFPLQEVRELIDQARQLMDDMEALSAADRRLLGVCLMFKGRQ